MTRLPITLAILRNIMQHISKLSASVYESHLLNAMCSTAFLGFCALAKLPSALVLQIDQVVKLVEPPGFVSGLRITFYDFKHSYNQRPVVLTLSHRSDICPVQHLLEYLSVRSLSEGQLFRLPSGSPVPRTFFTKFLMPLWP
jgi:hypothetical protein